MGSSIDSAALIEVCHWTIQLLATVRIKIVYDLLALRVHRRICRRVTRATPLALSLLNLAYLLLPPFHLLEILLPILYDSFTKSAKFISQNATCGTLEVSLLNNTKMTDTYLVVPDLIPELTLVDGHAAGTLLGFSAVRRPSSSLRLAEGGHLLGVGGFAF